MLLGTMLMRWGHDIVSIDNGAEMVIVSGEAYSARPLPFDLVGSRKALLIEGGDMPELPPNWIGVPKDRALDELDKAIGRTAVR